MNRGNKEDVCVIYSNTGLFLRFQSATEVNYASKRVFRFCFPWFISYDSIHEVCLKKPRMIPAIRLLVTALYILYSTRLTNSIEFHSCKMYSGGWMGVCKSTDPLWFNNQICPAIFDLNQNSGQKILFLISIHAKSKIWAQKIDESAIRCNCRIRRSIKISLWIWNPGKNIFKIHQSVRLLTPLVIFILALITPT